MRKLICDFCGKEMTEYESWNLSLKKPCRVLEKIRPDIAHEICNKCSDKFVEDLQNIFLNK